VSQPKAPIGSPLAAKLWGNALWNEVRKPSVFAASLARSLQAAKPKPLTDADRFANALLYGEQDPRQASLVGLMTTIQRDANVIAGITLAMMGKKP
jgi:hypothetical protein